MPEKTARERFSSLLAVISTLPGMLVSAIAPEPLPSGETELGIICAST